MADLKRHASYRAHFISNHDAATCFRVVEECGEMWFEPARWQAHLTHRLEEIVGGCATTFALTRVVADGPEIQCFSGSWTSDSSLQRSVMRYLADGGFRLLPELKTIAPLIVRNRELTYRQSELVDRAQYYSSRFYEEYMREHRIEDMLCSTQFRSGVAMGLSIGRVRREIPFTRRDEAVIALLTSLVSERLRGDLAVRNVDNRQSLSPRLRQVLDSLLYGASYKEIATQLHISTATVHEYVLAVYRHFGVRSRARLTSLFLRRSRLIR